MLLLNGFQSLKKEILILFFLKRLANFRQDIQAENPQKRADFNTFSNQENVLNLLDFQGNKTNFLEVIC